MSVTAPECLPIISHICSFLLDLSEYSKNRNVCCNSLSTLSLIALPVNAFHAVNDDADDILKGHLANSLKSFLPGFSQSFYRIITANHKVWSSIRVAAFNAWSSILISVFQNEPGSNNVQKTKSTKECEHFTSEWFKTTQSHITSLVSKTIDSVIHTQLELDVDRNVRLSAAFTHWLGVLLLKCHSLINIRESQHLRYTVVSGLLMLASQSSLRNPISNQSSLKESSLLAQKLLSDFTTIHEGDVNSLVVPKSLTNLFGHELIRKAAFDSLTEQVNFLLSQLLSLLDPEDICTFVHSSETFHRFCSALAKFLNFNFSSVELQELIYLLPLNYDHNSVHCILANSILPCNLFRKSFQYFRDHSTLMLIQGIAGKIASQRETIDLFLDTCRDIMVESDNCLRNSCLLLIIGAIAGYISRGKLFNGDSSRFNLIFRVYIFLYLFRSLMSLYFDRDILTLPTRQSKCVNSTSDIIITNGNNDMDYSTSLVHLSNDKIPTNHLSNVSTYKSWPPVNSNENPAKSEINQLGDVKMNSITICLLLEMFCTVSQLNTLTVNNDVEKVHTDQHFTECLRIGLLPTISFASRSDLIGQTARVCLDQVAKNCKYSSVSELITINADYLVSSITLDLHRVNLLTMTNSSNGDNAISLSSEVEQSLLSACNATNTLFEYCTINVLPVLKPMVTKMLSSLDVTYEYTTELFLTPFYQLMQTCRKWNELLTRNNKSSDRATDSSSMVESITNQQKMTNYSECSKSRLTDLYQKTISLVSETRSLHHIEPINQTNGANYTDTLNQPEKIKMDPVNDDMDNDENHTFPDHLQIVEEVMLRCIHLMADGNPKLRILSMNVLKEGCLTLGNETNLLLPIVHKIWTSLMKRFHDNHAIVVEKAFDLLTVLSKVAGNFIRQRASSEIIPPLVLFLTRGATVSASASKSYKYLTSYRVQKRLLKEIGPLCIQMGLLSQSLRPVINVLVMYLDNSQPEGLQQAFDLLTVLSKVAGNFIRQRASSEIIPPLVLFLTRGATVSASASKSYKYLTSYRVQKRLLKEIGPLCIQMGLLSQSLRPVINVLVMYLDNSQPEGLQQVYYHPIDRHKDLNVKLQNISILLNKLHEISDEITK
ncbi:TELO2-interacting protein 1 [Schistosoma bovis]|uniref:TELO2-interacting protein 1 n=1 Tax=Schistosoma bovis TaxID=6184 RepID=A0A430QAZ2_SCHBO|nr:TELO2-interacting protein 1 [Schistosoma bovis]